MNFSGPATVAAGGTSTNFTLDPAGSPTTATATPSDGGAGGSFTPSSVSWVADATAKTFVYNAPGVPGPVNITPGLRVGGFSVPTVPTSLNIAVVGAMSQRSIQFPQRFGPSPFGVISVRDQLPAAAVVTSKGNPMVGGLEVSRALELGL